MNMEIIWQRPFSVFHIRSLTHLNWPPIDAAYCTKLAHFDMQQKLKYTAEQCSLCSLL